MALADYDTAAEKIAALSYTMMDPSSASIATTDFTTNEVIWAIAAGKLILNGLSIDSMESPGFSYRINVGDVVELGGYAMVYIKDSDIILNNDIIELYQNRLARILETDVLYFSNGGSMTAGTYGSLLLSSYYVKLTTGHFIKRSGVKAMLIPIPPGQGLTCDANTSYGSKYFDVPSDW